MNKSQRFTLGIVLLVLVDIIWVSTGELEKFFYENEQYNKPFFCTFFKTSMFTIYLVCLGVVASWKETCAKTTSQNYILVDQTETAAEEDELPFQSEETKSLSDSTFVPIKGQFTDTESGDDASVKSVKFNKFAEVRELSSHEASEALMSRLSYAASLRFKRQKTHHKTARTALIFCVLWSLSSYLLQLALSPAEALTVTMFSSAASFFTLVLASASPASSGDGLSLSKLLAVILSCSGVVMTQVSEIETLEVSSRTVVLALLSAFFYASYLQFVRRKNETEERIDLPLFFGFVGVCNIFLMWPFLFVLNFSRIEPFEMPSQKQFALLAMQALIGTVLGEAIWLFGCFLTSSLVACLALALKIPISVLFNFVLRDKSCPPLFFVGASSIVLALVFVAFLAKNDNVDPLLRLLKIMYRKLRSCRKTQPYVYRVPEGCDEDLDELCESLIEEYES